LRILSKQPSKFRIAQAVVRIGEESILHWNFELHSRKRESSSVVDVQAISKGLQAQENRAGMWRNGKAGFSRFENDEKRC